MNFFFFFLVGGHTILSIAVSLKQSLQAPGNKKMYFVLEVDRGFTELETRCSLMQSFEIY